MTPGPENDAAPGWEVRERPPMLFRRFEFDAYRTTRTFLDALEALSKEQDYYPDLGFATTYVNVTVQARDGKALAQVDYDFAVQVTALAGTR